MSLSLARHRRPQTAHRRNLTRGNSLTLSFDISLSRGPSLSTSRSLSSWQPLLSLSRLSSPPSSALDDET
ncbi:hypothetical protein Sjap_003393 [Stephania japonica]|uniref:Uncharacterized protein n=1 Tax=Stephania japonica TaxID=461633 RepID=A0AAP0KQ91_9MAGN